MRIEYAVLEILNNSEIQGNTLTLPPNLEKGDYLDVMKVISALGGAWNKKIKKHIFFEDIEALFCEIINTGHFTPLEDKSKTLNYFPTPPSLAKKIVDLAEISDEHHVLEPSCGQGAILEHLLGAAQIVSYVEIDKDNFEIAKKKVNLNEKTKSFGFCGDFLAMDGISVDRVVMNPPFNIKGQPQCEIDHVYKAYSVLKTGGILVSIMSESPFFRENKKSVEFRMWLCKNKAVVEGLPEGSFKESGTMVRTRYIKIKK